MKYFPETFALIDLVAGNLPEDASQLHITRKVVVQILLSASLERNNAIRKISPLLKRDVMQYTRRVKTLTKEILEVIVLKGLSYKKEEVVGEKGSTEGNLVFANGLTQLSPLLIGDNSQLSNELDILHENHQTKILGRLGEYLNEENELQVQLSRIPTTSNMYVSIDLDSWLSPCLPDTLGEAVK